RAARGGGEGAREERWHGGGGGGGLGGRGAFFWGRGRGRGRPSPPPPGGGGGGGGGARSMAAAIASPAAWQMKSTTYGPIGVWRRKLAPFSDEHAVPTIRFARHRSNSLAAIAPARVASSIHASWVLLHAQSSWVLFSCPLPNPPPQAGEGAHRV